MASGWANDDAVQEQIDSTINDAIARARNELSSGESNKFCEECGEPIPEARRRAVAGSHRHCCGTRQPKSCRSRPDWTSAQANRSPGSVVLRRTTSTRVSAASV